MGKKVTTEHILNTKLQIQIGRHKSQVFLCIHLNVMVGEKTLRFRAKGKKGEFPLTVSVVSSPSGFANFSKLLTSSLHSNNAVNEWQ